ncbi:MAG: glycosyltransferase family 2 protein [Verrucomicrobiae bacterium]|nr:glycosyltransferase family 2 protein [Verrucomicrobiae bacterium]
MKRALNYVIITPVRNEAEFLPLTIRSVVAQTIRPTMWIIVNDGSRDKTGALAEEAARTHSWIRVVHRSDRGFRQAGSGVMEAFYDGYKLVEKEPWEFLVKLDGDLSFEPNYFERCFQAFAADPRLGIAGGTICSLRDGVPQEESKIDPTFHVRGATKIYRAECWRAIGGLIRAPGWDTVDEVKANMLGWRTRTLEGINAIHHRPTGAAYGSWNDMAKGGVANYIAGYHPLFMFLKCIRRLADKPYIIGGCALWAGYTKAWLKRMPRVGDPELIRYFQRQQMNRLLGRDSLWRS